MGSSEGIALITLGAVLLAGYLAYVTGPLIRVPRVTLLLVLGVICGPSLLDLVPQAIVDWFPFVAHMALAMVGFLLGERFVGKAMGFALLVQEQMPEIGDTVLPLVIGTTVLFEISGPLLARLQLQRSEEWGRGASARTQVCW